MGVLNAVKQVRPTVLYAGLAISVFVVLGIAIYKINQCKEQNKGVGYGLIMAATAGAVGIALFNAALYFQEQGAEATKASITSAAGAAALDTKLPGINVGGMGNSVKPA